MSHWEPFDEEDAHDEPLIQFRRWYDDAAEVMAEREAITVVTATPEGHPSARMVLLRHVGGDGLGWFTNYSSRKGRELAANPRAAILWFCQPRGRQVRVEGSVSRMSVEASDAYFAARPRGHQIGAHASPQSDEIVSRAELEERQRELEARFAGLEVPRPAHWGGYLLEPEYWEFWQQRPDRLHDRLVYEREGEGWRRRRLAP